MAQIVVVEDDVYMREEFQNVSNISAKPGGAMKSYAPPMKRPRKALQLRVFSGVKCSRPTPVFPHIAALLLPPCSPGAGR